MKKKGEYLMCFSTQAIWNKIVFVFPELKDVPLLLVDRCTGGLAEYQPQYQNRPWGIRAVKDMEMYYKKREEYPSINAFFYLAEDMLENKFGYCSPELLFTFVLLHEAGHHADCIEYKEKGKSSLDWLEEYWRQHFDYEEKVEPYMPYDFLAELYREMPHEQKADQIAIRNLIIFAEMQNSL